MVVRLAFAAFIALASLPLEQPAMSPAAPINQAVLATIPVPDFAQFLAVNTTTNRVYVETLSNNALTVIDGNTNSVVGSIPVGGTPTGLAVDAGLNRIYAASFSTGRVVVVDGATDQSVGSIDVSPAALGYRGGSPLLMAVNPQNHRVYVGLLSAPGSVAVIDGTSGTVIDVVTTGGTPTGIGVNPVTNRIYATDQDTPRVLIIDGATNALVGSIGVASALGGSNVGVNKLENRVYAISRDLLSTFVIDAAANAVVDTLSGCCLLGIAYDEATNRLYGTNGGSWTIDVRDGSNDQLLQQISLGANPLFGIDVNSSTGRVYADTFFTSYSVVVIGRPLSLDIDIKPGLSPNSVALTDRGLLPVAVLSSASFDVTRVDPSTLSLSGSGVALRGSPRAPRLAYSFEDVNKDGRPDLIALFDIQTLVGIGGLTSTTTALTLSGTLFDGTVFQGIDSVQVVP